MFSALAHMPFGRVPFPARPKAGAHLGGVFLSASERYALKCCAAEADADGAARPIASAGGKDSTEATASASPASASPASASAPPRESLAIFARLWDEILSELRAADLVSDAEVPRHPDCRTPACLPRLRLLLADALPAV